MPRTYEAVAGYFVQGDPEPILHGDQKPVWCKLPPGFGLIDHSWSKFKASIQQLIATAPASVQYKVIFLGRHGEGYHNIAEAKYGKQAWDDYWSKLDGDEGLTWGPDPPLTPIGEGQAEKAHAAWQKELQLGLPLPEKLYCSPLTRAIRTHQRTFDGLLPDGRKTVVVEKIREQLGAHTCDKRRTRSYIQQSFPEYIIEDGFTEEDELWKPDIRETRADVDVRAKAVLDMIFENDNEHFISIVTHGGFTGAFLRVTRHPFWILPTGGVLPVVVRASTECLHA